MLKIRNRAEIGLQGYLDSMDFLLDNAEELIAQYADGKRPTKEELTTYKNGASLMRQAINNMKMRIFLDKQA